MGIMSSSIVVIMGTSFIGNSVSRTCAIIPVNDCKTANNLQYCFCNEDLCNGKTPHLRIQENSERKSEMTLVTNGGNPILTQENPQIHSNKTFTLLSNGNQRLMEKVYNRTGKDSKSPEEEVSRYDGTMIDTEDDGDDNDNIEGSGGFYHYQSSTRSPTTRKHYTESVPYSIPVSTTVQSTRELEKDKGGNENSRQPAFSEASIVPNNNLLLIIITSAVLYLKIHLSI